MIPAGSDGPGRIAVVLLGMLCLAGCARGEDPSRGPARRIVSLSPSATEILFALGAGDRVVARSRYCDEPPEARRLPAVGDAFTVSAERVAALDPDLVLAGSRTQLDALSPLRERTRVVFAAADSLGEVRALIARLGELTGRPGAAARLTARIDRALARARRPGSGTLPPVLFVVQHEPLVVAGGRSYVGELLAVLGVPNAAGDLERPWPVLSLEALVARNPGRILDATEAPAGDAEVLAFWARFPSLAAVKAGAVVRVREPALVRPGPRLPEALRALARLAGGEGR